MSICGSTADADMITMIFMILILWVCECMNSIIHAKKLDIFIIAIEEQLLRFILLVQLLILNIWDSGNPINPNLRIMYFRIHQY